MARGGESVNKRRITAQRNERKTLKGQKREKRVREGEAVPGDQTDLMERFQRINERRASGAITDQEFELQRHQIFVALGLEVP